MTEEELKEWKEEIKQERIEAQGEISQFVDGESLLFLIDKIFEQQKEIKALKKITQNYKAIGGETFGDDRIIVCSMKYFDDGFFKRNFIWKDKIREKLDYQYELWNTPNRQKEYNLELAETLEELLGED